MDWTDGFEEVSLISLQYQHGQVTQPVVHLMCYVTHTVSCVTHQHEDDTMAHSRLSLVFDNRLFLHDEEKNQLLPVIVGSESWYSWLANERNQSFRSRKCFYE